MKWTPEKANMDWFVNGRFGLFIHWGIYSMHARSKRLPSWLMGEEQISPEEYKKMYFEQFNPDLFEPKEWAKKAKEAGMKYMVITTKHHDGFCLWDTELTNYKATNTPAGRDLIKPVVEAFRNEGLKIGFYHSVIDWHHPEFPIDGLHPQREDETFKNQERDIEKYRDYLYGQVRELLTNYGRIDYMWFDFSYPNRTWGGKGKEDWKSEELEDMVMELMPGIVMNDRLDLDRGIRTPEQVQPNELQKKDGELVLWEACQTMNGSWGYERNNYNWKSSELLIKMLVDTVSKDGNMLLNVGPTSRGVIDPNSLKRLEEIGNWMRFHSRSIYEAGMSNYEAPQDCRFTQKGNKLYLHIFSWPFEKLHIKSLNPEKIKYAQFLHDGSEVLFDVFVPHDRTTTHPSEKITSLKLPVRKPDVPVPVVELFLYD